MAVVNILDAFGYKWAETGTVEALDDAQYKAGWAFIGATPPSVEQFNKVHQIADEKANYLYGQMAAVFIEAGQVPAAGTGTTLRDSLRALSADRFRRFVTSGSFTVPAGVTQVWVSGCAAGGGGNFSPNTFSNCSGGGGGGGAGQAIYRQAFAVVPGAVHAITIPAGGAAGAAGGNTVIGTLITLTGGGAGAAGAAGAAGSAPGGIGGAGGSGSATGSDGQDAGNVAGTGNGGTGASGIFGGGGRGSRSVLSGAALPGGGGGGFGAGGGGAGGISTNSTSTGAAGGAGSGGLVIIEW